MSLLIDLAAWSMTAFGLVLFAAQAAARELGFAIGRRAREKSEREGVGILVGAILGLMAFVLALTLAFANTRFAERRAGALAEANAIGTAWLRASAIDNPRAAEIARLLAEYTTVRADFVRASLDPAAIAATNARTGTLQTTLWGHATAIARERPDPIVAALMAALNDTFDAATAERFAFSLALPTQLVALLGGMALLAMGALGFQLGLRGNPHRVLAMVLTAVWTLVMVEILDLGAARIGALRTSAAVYDWTLQSFQGGVPVPPPAAR